MVGNKSTFIQLPQDIKDPLQLRRFLDKLVQQLDIAFGNRGTSPFVTTDGFLRGVNTLQELISAIQEEAKLYSKTDGSRAFTGVVSYDEDKQLVGNNLVDVHYVEGYAEPKFAKRTAFNKDFGSSTGTVTEGGTTTNNPIQPIISDLNQTISDPPTQAEVQAISDKVDAILDALRNANILQI